MPALPRHRPRDIPWAKWVEMKAARKAEIAAEKLAKDKDSMTCQICGRRIYANTGMIAHHGYERPGGGYQTDSCMGARALPFEVNRDTLYEDIGYAEQRLEHHRAHFDAVKHDRVNLSIEYYVYPVRSAGKPETHHLHGVTRDNFEEKKIECPQAFKDKHGGYNRAAGRYDPYTFDVLKEQLMAQVAHRIKQTEAYLKFQQKRYDEWVQTHEIEKNGDDFIAWKLLEKKP